jgi:hypothetical protein
MANPWDNDPDVPQGGGNIYAAPQDPVVARGKQLQNDSTAQRMALARQAEARAQASERRAQTSMEGNLLKGGIRIGASGKPEPIPGWKPPQATTKDNGRLASLNALAQQIRRAYSLYQSGPGKTSGLAGLADYLPTPANKQFDTVGAGIGEMGLSAFRTPGVGSQSDAELKAFVDANRPSSRDYDTQIVEKLGNLENRLSETYKSLGQQYKPIVPRSGGGSKVIDFNDLP